MLCLNIGVLIAAAGKSERMGCDKALLPVFGQSLLAISANTFCRIKPSGFYITLPPHLILNERLRQELFFLNRKAIFINRYPEQGYAGSIKTIFEHIDLRQSLNGMLIMPVDTPLLNASLLVALINCVNLWQRKATIIVPYFHYLSGHPVYISRHFFRAFEKNQIRSLRELILANKNYLRALFWPNSDVVLNLNYPLDFETFVRGRLHSPKA